MPPKNQNSLSGIKDKLDALDYLPGELPTDKPALWNKLHERLENKPKKSYAFAYWAAACMLFVLGAFYMQKNKPENKFVTINKQQSSQPEQTDSIRKPNTDRNGTNQRIALKEQEENVVTQTRRLPQASYPQNPYFEKDAKLTVAIPRVEPEQTIVQPAVQPDTALQTLAQTQVRKLKVVHINNLGKLNTAKPMAPDNRALTTKTISPEFQENASSISYSRNGSDELLKIRLTPTN